MPRLPPPPKQRKSTLKPAQYQPAQGQLHQLFIQGVTHHQQGHLNHAKAIYESVIQIEPRHADALHLLGVIASQTNNYEQAADLIGQAIAINPRNEAFYSNRGVALSKTNQLDAAIISFDNAIRIKPDYAQAYSNRGMALHEHRRLEEALASYDKAIKIKPDYVEAYSNRGAVLRELNRIDEALASCDKALSLLPHYAEAQWNKGLALLLRGDFVNGWKLYESRWKRDSFTSPKRNFPQPLWLGDAPLHGKTILLHGEQGLGDSIQFCRYSKMVKAHGARVVLEVPKPLASLFQTLEGVDDIVETGKPLPAFDYHCPLLSLPLAFNTQMDTIPCKKSYLQATPHKIAQWNSKLGEKSKPRVGIVWSGSAAHHSGHNRSMTLEMWLPHLLDSVQYVCLQKELREVDQAALKSSSIQYWGNEIADFTDTAALCELMDVIISVDTSVAHLAGAMGMPTWILLPYVPDWRWMLNRNDCPWYESVRLFRQDESKDWDSVLRRAAEDLSQQYQRNP